MILLKKWGIKIMWNTKNYKGEPVTWYSEEDIKKYKDLISKIKNTCNGYVYTRCNETKGFKKLILNLIQENEK